MNHIATEKVRALIKKMLKKENKTYSNLGEFLGVTESAVKRFMRKGDLSLERIEEIANYFSLSLIDFINMTDKLEFKPFQLNERHERLFEKKPISMYIFLLLGIGLPTKIVQEKSGLASRQFNSVLYALDKAGLIELNINNKIRILGKAPYSVIKGGVLEKKYFSKFLKNIKKLIQDKEEKEALQIPFELYLSPKLFDQMKVDTSLLYKKYRELSRIDQQVTDYKEIQAISGLFFLRNYDSWWETLKKP